MTTITFSNDVLTLFIVSMVTLLGVTWTLCSMVHGVQKPNFADILMGIAAALGLILTLVMSLVLAFSGGVS